MSDWKEYLEKAKEFRIAEWTKEYNQAYKNGFDNSYNHLTKELGLFFWGRGGKQFVYRFVFENGIFHEKRQSLDYLIPLAKQCHTKGAGDFLDCVACLSKTKVLDACDICNEHFEEGEKVICDDNEEKHYHKDCYKEEKECGRIK